MMNKWIKSFFYILIVLSVLFITFIALCVYWFHDTDCDIGIIQNATSPDGVMDLVIALADCGNGRQFDVHRVYMVPKGKPYDDKNIAFQCVGATAFMARWIEKDHIRIRYCSENDPSARNGTKEEESISSWSVIKFPKSVRWYHPQVGRNMTVEIERRCSNE